MTKSKLDPEMVATIETVMGDLLERFEEAEGPLDKGLKKALTDDVGTAFEETLEQFLKGDGKELLETEEVSFLEQHTLPEISAETERLLRSEIEADLTEVFGPE